MLMQMALFVAWPLFVLSTIIAIGHTWGYITYTELQRVVDLRRGIRRVFYVLPAAVISMISAAFLYAYYFPA